MANPTSSLPAPLPHFEFDWAKSLRASGTSTLHVTATAAPALFLSWRVTWIDLAPQFCNSLVSAFVLAVDEPAEVGAVFVGEYPPSIFSGCHTSSGPGCCQQTLVVKPATANLSFIQRRTRGEYSQESTARQVCMQCKKCPLSTVARAAVSTYLSDPIVNSSTSSSGRVP